jgi:23S rRNA (uracil1939-C5)-methyltransferase
LARKKIVIPELHISGIADKGKAVGRTDDGQVIFVEGPVPGDVVEVLVLRKKKNYSEAVVRKYISFSEDRITAPCRHFGVCGGCKWQHMSYTSQLQYKNQMVRDCIRRIAKLDPDIVQPIIGCDDNFHYRNKLEFSFSNKRWITNEEAASDREILQEGGLGFHKAGFFDKIVNIDECLLQDDFSNRVRNHVRDFAIENEYSYYDLRAHNGLMRNLIIRNTTLNEWMLIVIFGERDQEKIDTMMQNLSDHFPEVSSLNYVVNLKMNDTIFDQEVVTVKGNPYIVEKLGDVRYKIGTKSFFQTNSEQAKRLFDVAADYAGLEQHHNVYDLYTGLGSIALYIASKAGHVTGIEEVPEAIDDALINMTFNDIRNTTFYAGDVKDILNEDFIRKHGRPDVVITDPPRAGMHEDVINTLLELEAPVIVYISCNPATHGRDLLLLSEKYDVTTVQPVDMFPHTQHIESVAKLILRKNIP